MDQAEKGIRLARIQWTQVETYQNNKTGLERDPVEVICGGRGEESRGGGVKRGRRTNSLKRDLVQAEKGIRPARIQWTQGRDLPE